MSILQVVHVPRDIVIARRPATIRRIARLESAETFFLVCAKFCLRSVPIRARARTKRSLSYAAMTR